MTFSIRPAIRIDTPLIIGLAGPSKSGKTYSAHRLARGLAKGGVVVMINAEGARGHQYADRFKYQALDIEPPYSYARYDEALQAVADLKPACVIVDSISHAHDGPGGMIEEHDQEVERRADGDFKKAERVTWAAWIKPKQAEGKFIYRMLGMNCPIILCFRAKEKIKIVPGKEPVDLGYQPIASERISFETIFSLMLPPRSKGVPDLALSDLREPFDTMHYITEHIVPRGSNVQRTAAAISEWMRALGPDIDITTIKREQGRAVVARVLGRGLKPATARRIVSVGRATLHHERREERIKEVVEFADVPAGAVAHPLAHAARAPHADPAAEEAAHPAVLALRIRHRRPVGSDRGGRMAAGRLQRAHVQPGEAGRGLPQQAPRHGADHREVRRAPVELEAARRG
jgi:hypothetical protein